MSSSPIYNIAKETTQAFVPLVHLTAKTLVNLKKTYYDEAPSQNSEESFEEMVKDFEVIPSNTDHLNLGIHYLQKSKHLFVKKKEELSLEEEYLKKINHEIQEVEKAEKKLYEETSLMLRDQSEDLSPSSLNINDTIQKTTVQLTQFEKNISKIKGLIQELKVQEENATLKIEKLKTELETLKKEVEKYLNWVREYQKKLNELCQAIEDKIKS